MQRVNILLIGFGHVGRALIELLHEQRGRFAGQGFELRILGVATAHGSVYDSHGLELPRLAALAREAQPISDYPWLSTQLRNAPIGELIARNEADIVVELTPTNLEHAEPGLSHVSQALRLGCHVVTANKGPLALCGGELEQLRARTGTELGIEGSVLGGTPLLHLARGALRGQRVLRVRGILNGTCNYILSQMETGLSFADALADAQAKGYAEADPGADVDGLDTLAKTAILAQQFFGRALNLHAVPCTGIRALTAEDVRFGLLQNAHWKLVADLREADGELIAHIGPQLLPAGDPLAQVSGVQNAVAFETDCLDNFTVKGPGAGPRATASAVLADVLRISDLVRAQAPALSRKRA